MISDSLQQLGAIPTERLKMIGCSVLLEPFDTESQMSKGGILQVNWYKKSNLKFRVLAVGPGEWSKNPKTKRSRFDAPEVSVGDSVICRAWLAASESEMKGIHHFDDGTGRILLRGRDACSTLILSWPQTPNTPNSQSLNAS